MIVNSKECEAAGVDEKEVARIARGLSKYAKAAKKLNIQIFGGSDLSLRLDDGASNGNLVIAEIHEGFIEGGCGARTEDENGLLRGEYF